MLDPQTGNEHKCKNRKKAGRRPDGRTNRHIILPIKGFEPVACGHMRCDKLRTTHIIVKKGGGQPGGETEG